MFKYKGHPHPPQIKHWRHSSQLSFLKNKRIPILPNRKYKPDIKATEPPIIKTKYKILLSKTEKYSPKNMGNPIPKIGIIKRKTIKDIRSSFTDFKQ